MASGVLPLPGGRFLVAASLGALDQAAQDRKRFKKQGIKPLRRKRPAGYAEAKKCIYIFGFWCRRADVLGLPRSREYWRRVLYTPCVFVLVPTACVDLG